jgi:signal transduction histidine kinase/CheY-like chemotaxis protein
MNFLLRKTQDILVRYAQAFLVLLAFALMVVSSYLFVSRTENEHLKRDAENAILNTEANIKSDMQELETLLDVVSETISDMIISGEDSEAVNQYILFINNYVEAGSGKRLHGATGIFGVFNVFGGLMLIGYDSWTPPDNYSQTVRPWYTGAVLAAGEISITEPYKNEYSHQNTITLSRRIFDHNRSALGIICLNIELDRIAQHVVSTQFVEGGYGFLLSENFMIISHPDPEKVGMSFSDVKSEIPALKDELMEKGKISEVVAHDYRGIRTIVFMERLQNGWYMGVVTPRERYLQSTRNLAIMLTALGAIFAAFLVWMLLRIAREKDSSDERVKVMFNSSPLVAYIFNKDFKVIDCNQNAVTLFDLSNKQEFCDRFYDLLPKYQPDGRLSADIGTEITNKTLKEGSSCFEWIYRKLNGEMIPCEITCVRVMYKNDLTIIGYMRDLREQKKMLKEIQQNSRLLDTVNSAATVLLSSNNEDAFETLLMKSFALVGRCLDLDRVQIWLNEMIEGDMHFVLRHEWLSEYGKACKPVPIGLHFPYSMKKEWESKFLRGENINAPLRELPEDDQAFLGYYQMKSIAILPMFLDGDFWGFFSIDDCRNERTFSNEEINILTSAGLMMSSAVNRDIQADKMREVEERTQIMIDAAPFCAIFWDKKLNLIDCNQEVIKMFGVSSKQEFINEFKKFSPEYQPDGILSVKKGPKLVNKALDEGYSRFEWIHQKLNGELIPAEVTCIRVKHRNEYTVTEYIRDLREQKAMLAEMRKAEIAEESSKAKSDFLAKMSHEIRTPMNAIMGIAEIQLQDPMLPQVTREALERIYNSGDLLLGIINDILDLSKIEAGKLELVPSQYDIASLINDTVYLNVIRYENKPIDFALEVDEKLPLMLIGDELRIKQILNNLLSNAFKYTHEGQIKLAISAETEGSGRGAKTTLVFCVSDTGQGMTAEQLRKLGAEYSRFNMEANRKTEGTGLGMNITRNLIQMMNGSISIESTPGMGSTFTVRLPQKRVGPSILGRELAESLMLLNPENSSRLRTVQIKREFMPYGRVLVVDDVETNLYVAKGLMAPYGLSIDTAMSGFEAIDKIRDGSVYDIIFMDHMMPRMDGIEATKVIRSLGYTKPIVALTANALAGQAELFLKNDFDDFISKPIDIRQLNMSLNKLIRDQKPPDVVEMARQQKNSLYSSSGQKQVDQQLAEFFIRDAKKVLTTLEAIYLNKCRRKDDIAAFIVNIHAMKSALANIGEADLSAEAAKLEQAGRDNNVKQIFSELPSFMELLYGVIEMFENMDKPASELPENTDNQFLKEKFLVIKAACVSMNKKTAKAALTELKQKNWPRHIKEHLGVLAGYLLHSEFDEAAKAIDSYIKQI